MNVQTELHLACMVIIRRIVTYKIFIKKLLKHDRLITVELPPLQLQATHLLQLLLHLLHHSDAVVIAPVALVAILQFNLS